MYSILLVFCAIIYVPALFIHLGVMPLIEDESIRALVALEMMITGDYWTPTLGGELYFKKPPLYNWILVVFFALFNHSDFIFRLPVVITLLLFCFTLYQMTRKEIGARAALLAALFFLSNGRILFYESAHGLIDILFSFLIFVNFIVAYRFFKAEDYKRLFLYTYTIIAMAFLLKGLPSLVFQAFSLIALFVWKRRFWKLFHSFHFIGVALLLAIIGSYYTIYFNQNEGTIAELFTTLFTETTRRTPIRFGILETLKHLVRFPLELIYHFLPWTLLMVFFLYKKTYRIIRQKIFLQYLLLMAGVNIIVYWISPEVHPRYVLMLIALVYLVLAYLYFEFEQAHHPMVKYIHIIFMVFATILILAPFGALFVKEIQFIQHIPWKVGVLTLLNMVVIWFWLRNRKWTIFAMVLILGVFRLGFDFFVVPHREADADSAKERDQAIQIGKQTMNNKLFAYWEKDKKPDPYYGKRVMQYAPMYYITRERLAIIQSISKIDTSAYYLSYPEEIKKMNYQVMDVLELKNGEEISLVKFRNP